jgi:hypothetical protein
VERADLCPEFKLLDEGRGGIREGKFWGWNGEPVDKFRRLWRIIGKRR